MQIRWVLKSHPLVVIAVGAIYVLSSGLLQAAKDTESVPVELSFTESGEPLDSLFVGISPNTEAKRDFLSRDMSGYCKAPDDPENSSSFDDILNWFGPWTAAAASCTSTRCAGHHMDTEIRFCVMSCGSIYTFHYSNPLRIPYASGWKYTGTDACNGCLCREVGCISP